MGFGLPCWAVLVGLMALTCGLGLASARLLVGTPALPAALVRRAAPPAKALRVDRLGDPLPPDALHRLGSLRRWYFGGRLPPARRLVDGATLFVGWGEAEILWIDRDRGLPVDCWRLPPGYRTAGYSVDGRLGLLQDQKRRLELWDLTTLKQVGSFAEQLASGETVSARFSPDGRTVVTVPWTDGSPGAVPSPGLLRVWDTTTGRQRWTDGRLGSPRDCFVLDFRPGRTTLMLVSFKDNRVSVREVGTGRQLRAFSTVPAGKARMWRMTPDGKHVLVGTAGKTVRVWEMSTGRELAALSGHTGQANHVAVAADGRTVVTGGQDPFVLVWDWPAGKLRRRIDFPLRREVSKLNITADGKRLQVLLWGEGALRLFDLSTGKELPGPREAHTGQVTGVAITGDGRVVSAGLDDTFRVWDLATGRQLLRRATGHPHGPSALAVSADGRWVATGDLNEGRVQVFHRDTGRLIRTLHPPVKSIRNLHFGRGRQLLIQGGERGPGEHREVKVLALWDAERGREVRRLDRVLAPGTGCAISPDGRQVIVGGDEVLVLDAARGQTQRILPVKRRGARVDFASNGHVLACLQFDLRKRLTLWELASGQPRWQVELPGRWEQLEALCLSPDGRWIAIAWGREVELWDALRGTRVHTFAGHATAPWALAFAPDGRRLASAGADTTVLVWDVAGVLARRRRPAGQLAPTALTGAWQDLAGRDARRAARAMALLVEAAGQSVPLMRARLKPLPAPYRKLLARLLARLDSDEVADRQKASAELEKLGAQAEEALSTLLEGKPSAEARRRA
jgi:WD40 repeat protein